MSRIPVSNELGSNGPREGRLFALKTRMKKKKRRKDLEQLRRNVLAAKRSIKRQSLQTHRSIANKLPKNSLKKTLNMFAEVRHDNENKTQGLVDRKSGKKSKGKTICARLLPEPVIGIFKNGVKGKDVRRKAVKNFPLCGMNKTQLHAEVFGLPNDEKTYSSSNEMSRNNRNHSGNSDRNEGSKDKRDFYSIPHHNFQPFDMIKGNSTFNNANSPKWISNSMGMRSSGEMRQMTSPKVLENVQRAGKYKRRVLKSSYDSDYDTNTARMETQHFFPNPLEANDGLIQKELPTNAITDQMRSIKRWGISPAFCYDEFSKMVEEKFISCLPHSDGSDPMMSIKATLLARYAEAREQQTNTNEHDEDSCTSCSQVVDMIPMADHNLTVHDNRNDSWTITRISPHSQVKQSSFFQSPIINRDIVMSSTNQAEIHDKTNEFLRKFEGEKMMSREYIMHQAEESPNFNWIIQPSLSSGGYAVKKKQKDYARSKGKRIPTQLQRSKSGPGIPVDMHVSEFCEIDDLMSFQETQKKSGKFGESKNYFSAGTTNFYLPPNVIKKGRNNERINEIYTNNEMTGIHEFSMPNKEFVKTHDENSYDDSGRVNTSKCHVDKIVAAPLLQIDFDDICERNYHHDTFPIDIKTHGHFPHSNDTSPLRSKTMYCSDYVATTNINSNSLANDDYIKQHDQEIVPIPAMDDFQSSSVPFWRAPNVNVNMKMNFLPLNTENTRCNRARYYSDTNVQLNNAVLHHFKDLSFEEDKLDRSSSLNDKPRYFIGDKQQSPRSDSNLYQPSKYYAVSKESDGDRFPRRVPMFTNAHKAQSTRKMMSEELMSRVNVLKKTGECVAAPDILNFKRDTRSVSNCRTKYKKNAYEFPAKCNRVFSINHCDRADVSSGTVATSTIPNAHFRKSFNENRISDACEILLDDGRIGLFVPRNCR